MSFAGEQSFAQIQHASLKVQGNPKPFFIFMHVCCQVSALQQRLDELVLAQECNGCLMVMKSGTANSPAHSMIVAGLLVYIAA
jgi:hypothetical protein